MKAQCAFFLLFVLTTLIDQANGQTFTLLHTFSSTSGPNQTNSDGANPSGDMSLSENQLFGTAVYGGASGWGTVFAVNTDGTGLTTVYHFTDGIDGASPSGGVILSNNILYGTASVGGSSGVGSVFAVKTNGDGFANLHSFTPTANDSFGLHTNSDGAHPLANLILSGASLYGAANDGGTSGHGTVFTVSTTGTGVLSLHSFSSGSGGAYSSAGLVLLGNTLYGTDYGSLGNGAIFSVNTDGSVFTNYYAFTSGHLNDHGVLTNSDGANPHAKLLLCGNTFYGTAENGGDFGNGTVFSITTDGTSFTTLHSFAAGAYNPFGLYTNSDGTHPTVGLTVSGGSLYCTAKAGGTSGQGTVFMLNTNGSEFVNLYNFTATPPYPGAQTNSDGANPSADLVLSAHTLYGTTSYGGSSGNGTVFSLSFTPRLTIFPSGANVILTWPSNVAGFDLSDFALQSAPAVTGVFTNVPGAQSPFTNSITGNTHFYRLRR